MPLPDNQLMVEQTWRILQTNDDIIEQDYMMPDNKWKDWILDEAGIANVKHFFTLLGKMSFTPYCKESFTYLDKQIFTFSGNVFFILPG